MTTNTLTSLLTEDIDAVLENARRNSLTRDNPALADLPAWWQSFRDHQRIAIREILCAYEEGAECVVLDAPTGSGKTVVGEAVRRLLAGSLAGQRWSSNQTTYICSSKALQAQFVKDYPYSTVLQGRSNYATERYPERWGGKDGLSCADCTKSPGEPESCLWCVSTFECPYEQAKNAALKSSLAVLNTSYFLSECNGPGRFSRGGLVIADECDDLENQLLKHVEVTISERRLKQYGLGVPRFVTKEESWIEWAEHAHEVVRAQRPRLRDTTDIQAIREQKRHTLLVEKLRGLKEGLAAGEFIYVGDRQHVGFKPVTVSGFGQDKLWQHGDKWLLMSATVISADELLESLGWDDGKDWRLVRVPSTFKPENRKVVIWPVASMTYKTKEESEPKIVDGVREVVNRHPDERILVHSTSYRLTNRIVEGLTCLPAGAGATAPPYIPDWQLPSNHCGQWCRLHNICQDDPSHPYKYPDCEAAGFDECPGHHSRPIFTYGASSEKEQALADYLATPATVLVAPSMDRGIDLPGDACRVQIICKVPFLSLSDKQVSARLYGTGLSGRTWYAVNAIRTIVQMTGRAVRSEEDYAVTYILDRQFVDNVWGSHKRLIPEWWKQAIEWRMKGL